MPITKRGVYHNLKESKFVVSNQDITFFFSSEHTLNKFMNGYEKYRDYTYKNIFNKTDSTLNFNTLSDIKFYKESEKRGFYVWLKGVSIDWEELNKYALRKMSEIESPVWIRTTRPNVRDRFTLMR